MLLGAVNRVVKDDSGPGLVRTKMSFQGTSVQLVIEPELPRTLFLVYSRRRPASKAFVTLHQLIRRLVAERISDKTWCWRPVEA